MYFDCYRGTIQKQKLIVLKISKLYNGHFIPHVDVIQNGTVQFKCLSKFINSGYCSSGSGTVGDWYEGNQ